MYVSVVIVVFCQVDMPAWV